MEENPQQPDRVELDRVKEKVVDALRLVGLYDDRVEWVPMMAHPVSEDEVPPLQFRLVGTFFLGDVAFSKRIQNPEQKDIDEMFAEMMHQERRKGFKSPEALADLDKLLDETKRNNDG